MICANRTDEPAFFTGCQAATGRGCLCGREVFEAETELRLAETGQGAPTGVERRPSYTDVVSGGNGTIQWGSV